MLNMFGLKMSSFCFAKMFDLKMRSLYFNVFRAGLICRKAMCQKSVEKTQIDEFFDYLKKNRQNVEMR